MDAKEKLLAAVIDRLTTHGLGDESLRGLAAAIGTSHRMLIYHFGSKEGLLVEVSRTIEARQRAAFAELAAEALADPPLTPVELSRRFWRSVSDPSLWPAERLFFELYGQALQGRRGTGHFLDGIVELWLEPLTDLLIRVGTPQASARAEARFGVAVARGLLLDLLATGDRAAVDEAYERHIEGYLAVAAARGRQPGQRLGGGAQSTH